MNWLYMALIAFFAGLVVLIVNASRRSKVNPEQFGRNFAGSKLDTLLIVKKQHPDWPQEQQYLTALNIGSAFKIKTIDEILTQAKHTDNEKGVGLHFKDLVSVLANIEYLRETEPGSRNPKALEQITQGVSSVIPEEL